jgi:hypothetical protein
MTLTEDGPDRFVWRCDYCPRSATAEGDFWACWALLKRRGWSAIKDDGTWFHCCNRCRRPEAATDIMSRKVGGA